MPSDVQPIADAIRQLTDRFPQATFNISVPIKGDLPAPAILPPEPALPPNSKLISHSPDFSSVNWYGTVFVFTPIQRAIVSHLWEAMEDGHGFVGGAMLLEAAGCVSKNLYQVFRGHPAGEILIVPGQFLGGKVGTYRLADGPIGKAGVA